MSVRQIFSDFQAAVARFQAVQYNILDVESKSFDDDFYDFRCVIKELERRLGSVIIQAFDDCTTVAGTFKLLDSFEGLLEREIIQADLEKKHADLLRAYAHDLRDVADAFHRQQGRAAHRQQQRAQQRRRPLGALAAGPHPRAHGEAAPAQQGRRRLGGSQGHPQALRVSAAQQLHHPPSALLLAPTSSSQPLYDLVDVASTTFPSFLMWGRVPALLPGRCNSLVRGALVRCKFAWARWRWYEASGTERVDARNRGDVGG